MATVRAFQIDGVKTWFWSLDHNPPHFHAKKSGEWEVRVHFLSAPVEMIEVVREKKQISRKAHKELTELALACREELLEQWEEIHCSGD